MGDSIQILKKTDDVDYHVRCVSCNKLIAKKIPEGGLEFKCLRCGRLNSILEHGVSQMVVLDPDGIVVFINKKMEDITGYSFVEAVGKKPSDLWGGNMPADFYKELWREIKEEKKSIQVRLENKNRSGEFYEVLLTIYPVFDATGDIMFYVGIEDTE